jgi:hypothetical protein
MKEKEVFLKEKFVAILANVDIQTQAVFGKMNVHQMIEHMSYSFQIANGNISVENKQSEELTAKMYRFMMSDKPFRDNTPNPNLSDEPLPPRFENVSDSLQDLQSEIDSFFSVFEKENVRIENPFFGNLNREEQIHLLHKHAQHHLRQFGVTQ